MEGARDLVRGGVYLARLDPVVILTDQDLLDIDPPNVFICPLSRYSEKRYQALHVSLPARENLHVRSYALPEHCRSITAGRLLSERLAQLNPDEIHEIVQRLQRLIDA